MKIKQISVFIENTTGRIADVTRVLKESGINLRALMVADTADFGILRIIADDTDKAITVLKNAGFITRTTEVIAAEISDKAGALHDMISLFNNNGINIEYMYASLAQGENAQIIFKVEDVEKGEKLIKGSL